MRLGQLARKLSLRPAQIVEFLAQKSIQIEENSNYRLADGHAEMIVRHFSPESLEEIISEAEEEIVSFEDTQVNVEPIVEPEAFENQSAEEIEVIRVQKIELSGLKVVGKIDLPEPKKKPPVEQEEDKNDSVDSENLSEKPAVKPRNPNRKSSIQNRERQQQRPWKNPLEFQREREARESKEKKRMDAEREKEKRKRHYDERVKSVAPTKRKPIKEQPVEKRKPADTRPVPKTWVGKFLRWWTT